MKNKAVILIATRPDSKRFPGKVFKKINGIPAIEHLLNRIEKLPFKIYLCVPNGCNDYNYLKRTYNVEIFKGDEASPLHRMADCVLKNKIKAPYVIRITHDDILIDDRTVIDLLKKCLKRPNVGYAISPEIVEGAGVEIIHRDNLIMAARERTQPTEFVSYFVKNGPRTVMMKMHPRHSIRRSYRLTMDYYEDFVLLEILFRSVGNNASLDKIIEYLDKNLYLLQINKLPTISVYTCAYNAEKYLHNTISSLLHNEQNVDYEFIFVDDGSTDKTLNVATRFAYDKRMKIIVNERNYGLASSSNIALNNCRGEYVMRLDADDLLYPNALIKMKNEIDIRCADIIYPAFVRIDENDTNISGIIFPTIDHHPGCALMDKRMVNEVRFTDGLRHHDGQELYSRIHRKLKIGYLFEPLWYYRQHRKSLSHNNLEEREKIMNDIQRKIGGVNV